MAEVNMALTEAEDRWLLPLTGQKVGRLCVDFAVTLVFTGDLELRIEQPFVITGRDGSEALVIPEGDSDRLAPIVQLARCEVVRADAFKDGHLELLFSNGTGVEVPPDEGFEAWALVDPDGMRMVSLPGGSLAIWRPSHSLRDGKDNGV